MKTDSGARDRERGDPDRPPASQTIDDLEPPHARERVPGNIVALRRRGERRAGARDKRVHERALGRVDNRHVDQQQAAARVGVRAFGRRARGGGKKPRPINSRRRMELLVESFQQRREIAAAVAGLANSRDRHHRERHFFERARQRAGKSRRVGNRRKIRQRPRWSVRDASKSARAATACTPSGVVGDRRSRASSGAARRAASCVRLSRCIPNVAAAHRAIVRAKSSAAAREAATIRYSVSGEASRTNRRAASRRTAGR